MTRRMDVCYRCVVLRHGECSDEETVEDDTTNSVQLLRHLDSTDEVSSNSLPEVLPEAGISEDRRKFLLENVAGFCHPENQPSSIPCIGGE